MANHSPFCDRCDAQAGLLLTLFIAVAPFAWVQTSLSQTTSDTMTVTVTIGADDSDGGGIPDDYEMMLGLNTANSSDDMGNLDDDIFSNLEEFWLGTDPTDSNSFLRVASVEMLASNMVLVSWDSSTNSIPLPREYEILSANSVTGLLEAATIETRVPANMASNQTEAIISGDTNQLKFYTVILPEDVFSQ